jgi:hypothetical protein
MNNILPHAYFVEVVWLVESLVTLGLVAWAATSTHNDRTRLQIQLRAWSTKIPRSYTPQADGSYRAELWRALETLGLLAGAVYVTFFHSLDGRPVIFWDLWENLQPMRLLWVFVTTCKLGASFTARYHRYLADLYDERRR